MVGVALVALGSVVVDAYIKRGIETRCELHGNNKSIMRETAA
jgi:hypothetical protein